MRKHIALFAGLGGFTAASNRVGIETVFATDHEKNCINTIKNSFKDVPTACMDICSLKFEDHFDVDTEIDILSAGFPCQSFSRVGTNLGFDDPRGQLFFEIPRLIGQLASPPKVIFLENVPFLKMFNNGSRLDTILQQLRLNGYWISNAQAPILNSRNMSGSPQSRERLYMVAYHSSYFKRNFFNFENFEIIAPQDLWTVIDRKLSQSDDLYLDKDSKYFQMLDQSIKKHGEDRLYQIRRVGVRACPENVCPTLTANMGGGGHNVPFLRDYKGIRKLSVLECLRMQGFEDGEINFPEDLPISRRYMMIGNAVHVDTVAKVFAQIDFSKEKKNRHDRMDISA